MKTALGCRHWLAGVAALTVLGSASAAWAGTKWGYTLSISSSNFSGSLANVRASSDANDYIGCVSNGSWAQCVARNSTTTKSCTSSDSSFIAAVNGIDASSFINVGYDAAGTCTWIKRGGLSYIAISQN